MLNRHAPAVHEAPESLREDADLIARRNAARDSRDWSQMLHLAQADKARRVFAAARTGQFNAVARARDLGIVPHAESRDCYGCQHFVKVNRLAAAVIIAADQERLPTLATARPAFQIAAAVLAQEARDNR